MCVSSLYYHRSAPVAVQYEASLSEANAGMARPFCCASCLLKGFRFL